MNNIGKLTKYASTLLLWSDTTILDERSRGQMLGILKGNFMQLPVLERVRGEKGKHVNKTTCDYGPT